MGWFWKNRHGRALSIDIGSSSIKLLVTEGAYPASFAVLDYRLVQIDTKGKPVSPDELPEILKHALQSLRYHPADIRTILPAKQEVVRVVELPEVNRDGLKKAAGYQLSRHVPFSKDEAVFDCVPIAGASAQRGLQKCVLVAARRLAVDQHNSLFQAVGILPTLVDVEPVAVMNAYIAACGDFDRESAIARVENGGVALIHLGALHTGLCILRGHTPVACRAIDLGGSEMIQRAAEALQVERAAALDIFLEGADKIDELRAAVERFVTEVGEEIKASLVYCRREFDVTIERLYITGGLANDSLVITLLGEHAKLPAYRFDPFVRADLTGLDDRVGDFRAMAATFAPLMGLAVRTLREV